MLGLRRCARLSPAVPRNVRLYSQDVQKNFCRDIIKNLEKDHSRLLRITRRRIDERKALLARPTDGKSTPADVACLKRLKETESLQFAWDDWIRTRQLLEETASLLDDPDPHMRSLALDEYRTLSDHLIRTVESIIPSLLVPPSPTASLSALVEMKAGVGGAESGLFLSEILRMYQRLAIVSGWNAQLIAKNETEDGGIKDAILEMNGLGAYDVLRWESGVHRVQRVPATDAAGRIHTSTVTVVVLPVPQEADSQASDLFCMDDVKVEVMRARGAGGQHVNKTESAVRLTHVPSGITVSMQDERSQHQNKRRAFQVLRARLMDQKLARELEERRMSRNTLVKTADRSEKIRTYNFAQERVTDHRIGLTLRNLANVLEGEGLQVFLQALRRAHDENVMEDILDENNCP